LDEDVPHERNISTLVKWTTYKETAEHETGMAFQVLHSLGEWKGENSGGYDLLRTAGAERVALRLRLQNLGPREEDRNIV
jgi:hypothetical protein